MHFEGMNPDSEPFSASTCWISRSTGWSVSALFSLTCSHPSCSSLLAVPLMPRSLCTDHFISLERSSLTAGWLPLEVFVPTSPFSVRSLLSTRCKHQPHRQHPHRLIPPPAPPTVFWPSFSSCLLIVCVSGWSGNSRPAGVFTPCVL